MYTLVGKKGSIAVYLTKEFFYLTNQIFKKREVKINRKCLTCLPKQGSSAMGMTAIIRAVVPIATCVRTLFTAGTTRWDTGALPYFCRFSIVSPVKIMRCILHKFLLLAHYMRIIKKKARLYNTALKDGHRARTKI